MPITWRGIKGSLCFATPLSQSQFQCVYSSFSVVWSRYSIGLRPLNYFYICVCCVYTHTRIERSHFTNKEATVRKRFFQFPPTDRPTVGWSIGRDRGSWPGRAGCEWVCHNSATFGAAAGNRNEKEQHTHTHSQKTVIGKRRRRNRRKEKIFFLALSSSFSNDISDLNSFIPSLYWLLMACHRNDQVEFLIENEEKE